jgi:drug/metabolite transporter (DMT)-like permease
MGAVELTSKQESPERAGSGTAPEVFAAEQPRDAGLRPEAALWFVVVIWSSTFIAMKDAFSVLDPLPYTFFRFLWIVALAFGVLWYERRRDPAMPAGIRRADWPRLIMASLCGYTLYQLCFVLGLDRSSIFTLSLLVALVPLFTMILLALMGEPTPPYGWLGLGVAVTGVVIFLSDKQRGDDTLLGALLSLGAAVTFALYGVINRPLAQRYSSSTYSAYSLLLGAFPFLFIGGPALPDQDWGAVPLRVWLGIVWVIIFPVYVAYRLWNYGIKHRGAAAASSYGLAVPVLSGVLSALFFDEQFGVAKIAGAALVLIGLLLLRVRRTR